MRPAAETRSSVELTVPSLAEVTSAYSTPPFWYDLRGFLILKTAYQDSLSRQVSFFAKNVDERHLEVAVGTGTLLEMVLRRRGHREGSPPRVVGIDCSSTMLAGARKRFRNQPNVEMRVGDAAMLDEEPGSFASANLANAFHCLSDPEAVLAAIHKALAPGGTLALNALLEPQGSPLRRRIASAVNAWGMQRGILVRPYRKREVRAALKAVGFSIATEATYGNCFAVVAVKDRG